jgi:hypothetical protein
VPAFAATTSHQAADGAAGGPPTGRQPPTPSSAGSRLARASSPVTLPPAASPTTLPGVKAGVNAAAATIDSNQSAAPQAFSVAGEQQQRLPTPLPGPASTSSHIAPEVIAVRLIDAATPAAAPGTAVASAPVSSGDSTRGSTSPAPAAALPPLPVPRRGGTGAGPGSGGAGAAAAAAATAIPPQIRALRRTSTGQVGKHSTDPGSKGGIESAPGFRSARGSLERPAAAAMRAMLDSASPQGDAVLAATAGVGTSQPPLPLQQKLTLKRASTASSADLTAPPAPPAQLRLSIPQPSARRAGSLELPLPSPNPFRDQLQAPGRLWGQADTAHRAALAARVVLARQGHVSGPNSNDSQRSERSAHSSTGGVALPSPPAQVGALTNPRVSLAPAGRAGTAMVSAFARQPTTGVAATGMAMPAADAGGLARMQTLTREGRVAVQGGNADGRALGLRLSYRPSSRHMGTFGGAGPMRAEQQRGAAVPAASVHPTTVGAAGRHA